MQVHGNVDAFKERISAVFADKLADVEDALKSQLDSAKTELEKQKSEIKADFDAKISKQKQALHAQVLNNAICTSREQVDELKQELFAELEQDVLAQADTFVTSKAYKDFVKSKLGTKGTVTTSDSTIVPKSFKGSVKVDKSLIGLTWKDGDVGIDLTVQSLLDSKRETIYAELDALLFKNQ